MKNKVTFTEGVGLALLISITGSVFFSGMISLFSGGFVFKILVMFISSGYIFYLLMRSGEKSGRITVLSAWLAAMVVNYLLVDSTLLFISIHITSIWLIRSLYYYNSVFSSLADILVSMSSLVAAVVAWNITNSLLMSLWCFFLIQALFSYIPRQFAGKSDPIIAYSASEQGFENAHKSAQIAIRKLSTL